MCEVTEIRYVHYMQHSDYPDTLEVGCVCAENMEEDYVGPYRREAEFRRRWLKRAWRVSRARNSYLNAMRFNAVVFLGAKAGVRGSSTATARRSGLVETATRSKKRNLLSSPHSRR
jgi:hypothetical protein